MRYAELLCVSNFSFQCGASHPRELFERAYEVGYAALAITDECSLAGIVRAYEASEVTGVPLIIGSHFRFDEGDRWHYRRPRGIHATVRAHQQGLRSTSPLSPQGLGNEWTCFKL